MAFSDVALDTALCAIGMPAVSPGFEHVAMAITRFALKLSVSPISNAANGAYTDAGRSATPVHNAIRA